MFRNYAQLMKMRTVRDIMGASVFFLIGYAIFCSDRMYFFTYNMDMSGAEITVIMMIFTFIAVAFIPLISGATRYPITKKVYGDVLDALARRKAGEEPDLEPFRKLK